jgi:cysteine desulfurase
MARQIYMDYNATAPMRPRAIEAVAAGLAQAGNPSSVHRFGRLARRAVESAREQIALTVGAKPAEILFVSGGSEANNLALKGADRTRILASAIEHDSVLAAAKVQLIPVDREGIVDLTAVDRMLSTDRTPALLSVMLANNETGAIQPIAEVVRVAHAHGALVHCDAVQALGRIALDLHALDVDFASFSAHKLGGPMGVGALYVRDGMALQSQIAGGGQERGRRAGTPNLPGIVGFGVVVQQATNDLQDMARIRGLRDRLEIGIKRLQPSVRIFSENVERLPNTSCFALSGFDAETQVIALDLAGIAVSAGAACSSGRVQSSHVLRAMGADHDLAGSAIRVSLGWQSEERDIDEFLTAWNGLLVRHTKSLQTETAA